MSNARKSSRASNWWRRWMLAALVIAPSAAAGCTEAGAIVGGRCGDGWLECNGVCVQPLTDSDNCGGCGVQCVNATCVDGVCDTSRPCVDGLTLCGEECVDLTSDPEHCGECYVECSPGSQHCEPGADGALATCICNDESLSVCGDACVDTTSDPNNCGACANECASDQYCEDSVCVCQDSRPPDLPGFTNVRLG